MAGSSTGAAMRMRMLREVTPNTAPGGNWWNIPFLPGSDLGTVQANVPNPTIGHGGDPAAPLRDVFDGKSDLMVPVDARYFGLHLAALLGDPVSTDIGTPYQHVFTSGAVGQPTGQSIEASHLGLASAKHALNTGIFYNGLSLSMKRSGFVEAKFDVIVTKEFAMSGSSAAGTPANLVDANIKYFSHLTGQLKRNDTVLADILTCDFDFSNNLQVIEAISNGGYISGADRGEQSLAVKASARFRTMTLLDDAVNGTPMELTWVLSNSADESLTITAAKVVMERPKVPQSGPAGIDVSFTGTGYGDASNKMLDFTLVNDHIGTAYAPTA